MQLCVFHSVHSHAGGGGFRWLFPACAIRSLVSPSADWGPATALWNSTSQSVWNLSFVVNDSNIWSRSSPGADRPHKTWKENEETLDIQKRCEAAQNAQRELGCFLWNPTSPACVALPLCTAFWAKTFNPAIVKLFFVRGCVCELSVVLRAVVVISSVTKAERSQGHIFHLHRWKMWPWSRWTERDVKNDGWHWRFWSPPPAPFHLIIISHSVKMFNGGVSRGNKLISTCSVHGSAFGTACCDWPPPPSLSHQTTVVTSDKASNFFWYCGRLLETLRDSLEMNFSLSKDGEKNKNKCYCGLVLCWKCCCCSLVVVTRMPL